MSGYKDSMCWATPAEVAEWRNRQDEQHEQDESSVAADRHVSREYRDDAGQQVSGCIRQFEPFVPDGFLL
jgi:hypothetical protein